MKESAMHKSIRTFVYREYGKAVVDKKGKLTGAVRVIKLSTLAQFGEAGWMDMCFWVIGAYVFLIELKQKGKKATELQEERAAELRALGFKVYLCDDVNAAKKIAAAEIEDAIRRYKKKRAA